MSDADFSVKAIISAQTSQFEKGIKNAQSSVNSLSSSISNITNLVKKAFAFTGVAIGTKAIVDFGKSCVQSANQAVKTFNILDNTVKATGADAWTSIENLESASKDLSDSTNYSVTEIQKMQSVLLGFTNITGEAFDGASKAVLDMATVMGMDLTSAVQTVGKALDDPITGLDSLRRQGFKFTDEQKAELAQLVKNGKQFEAQKIILDTLSISYGGAAKAGQDSFAKQRHAVENFSDTLGGKLIPLMKSFAMDNANMINSLRELIENMDFNQIGATIKVTFDGIKKGIQNSFEYVKMIFSETKSFMKNIDFKPIVSIINNLVLAFEKIGNINLSRITNIIQDLKDSFSGFSENIDLTKFSEVINLIINGFVFLYEEVSKVFDTLLDNIKTFITNTWNSIKSIFEAGNKALADSETDIKSWGDYFYEIFNNLFKTVQDVIQSISYLLSGDWEIAWQYAKLVVLRIVDSVIDSMTTMITAFKDKIISILNFAQMLSPFLGTSGKVIKTALSGIEALVDGVDKNSKKIKDTMTELVENTENKIEELTGKPADKNIKDLEEFTSGSKNILGEFVDNFKEATDKAKKELDNLRGGYKATTSSMRNDTQSTYEKFSEWDSKLLQQRLEDLDEWSDEYHEIQLALIEEERKKATDADKTGAETEKINEYYNKQIEKENERSEKAKRNKVKETMKVVLSTISNIAKKTVEVFKKAVSTISNAFSAIVNLVKSIGNIFSELFKFNPDEALDALLAVEDAILTFFVETLPRLPNFFESAFSSVLILIQTLINSIDWEKVKTVLDSIIKTFVNYAPQILSGIVELFSGLVTSISSTLMENAPEIVSAIGEMFFTILDALPGLISNFLQVAGTYLSEIGKYITDNSERLSKDLSDIVESIVKGISNFIESGGWRNVLSALLTIQNAIQNAITDNLDEIVNVIIEALPDLVDMLIKSIVSASKAMEKVIKPIIRLVLAVIEAIIDVLLSDEVLDAGIEAGFAIMDAIFDELIPRLAKLIPKLIVKIISFIVKNLPKLVKAMVEGIVKSFTQINWLQVITDIFTGFIDAIKDLFGIHSPSTLFESFGTYMVEGLVAGLKGISESVMIILQPLVDLVKGLFDGLFNAITEPINKVIDSFTKINELGFETLKETLKTLADLFTNLSNITFNAIIDLSKMGFDALIKVLETVSNLFMDLSKISFQAITDLSKIGFDSLNKSLDSLLGFLKDISEISFTAITDLTKISFDGLNNALDSVLSALKDITKISFKTFIDTLNIIKDVLKIISDTATGIVSISFNGFNDGIRAVGDSIARITDSVTGLVKALGELITKATEAVNALNPLKSGGGGNKTFEGWDLLDPLHIFPGHATGTNSASKGLALVGEAGPELVKFRGGEQVLNNRNTNKALANMGGTTINQNVTFNNLQDTTAYAMLQQLKQYNRQMAINNVL